MCLIEPFTPWVGFRCIVLLTRTYPTGASKGLRISHTRALRNTCGTSNRNEIVLWAHVLGLNIPFGKKSLCNELNGYGQQGLSDAARLGAMQASLEQR